MANLIKHLSIRKKLLIVLGASLFFAGGVILSGILHMFWMKRSSASIYERAVVEAQNVYQIKTAIEQVRRSLLMAILEKDPGRRQEDLVLVRKRTAEIDRELELTRDASFLEPAVREEASRLSEIWAGFKDTRDSEIIPLVESGKQKDALPIAMGLQEDRFREFTAITDRLIAHSNEKASAIQTQIEENFRFAIRTYAAVSIAGLLFACLMFFFISRELRGRAERIMEGIGRFQTGEQLIRLEAVRDDELGRIETALDLLFRQVYEYRINQEQYRIILDWEVSEKEQQRAELERSQEKFRALVETTSDWVWEVDANGVYTYASPRAEGLLGYRPEEVVGKTPFELMLPEEAQRISAVFHEIARKQAPFFGLVNRNLHRDGRIVVLETSGVPFYDGHGRFQGYRGIDRDVTERIRVEEEKSAMMEQLVHVEKMSSIGQLAAGVAHEINNPLGFVNSNLNSLSDYISCLMKLLRMYFALLEALESDRKDEMAKCLNELEEYKNKVDVGFILEDLVFVTEESKVGLKRIKKIVEGLRDFSHAGEEAVTGTDVNKCVNDAIRLTWHELKYSAQLEEDLGEIPHLPGKPQQLTQVFVNILMNAVQAMEKGRISIKTFLEGPVACVRISDNGAGMSEDVQKRIFDPFFTTKPLGKGTGLGLSIVYGIVSAHGGTIQVKSAPGNGTTFTIRLPLKREIAGAA